MHENNRILIVDDNQAIHDDFTKILSAARPDDDALDGLMAAVFGSERDDGASKCFEMDSAFQGQEALAKVEAALAAGRPYAMAFVDVRMPPGWDGIETIARLWACDPAIQIVLCTAYSDYSWNEIVRKLGASPRLVILKKPFDNIEALQLAHAMTQKWSATRLAEARAEDLERMVQVRTKELQEASRQLTREMAEREQAQAALGASDERLARAFDACPLASAILSVRELRVVQANPAMLAMSAMCSEEIAGRTLWETGVVAEEEFRSQALATLFSGQAIRRRECELAAPPGESRRGLLWLEPFALASGPHVLAIVQDISAQCALEAQLRQAQKMEAVGQLAAGVAHDFNNLLTIIQCHTSLRLEEGNLDREVEESIAAVQEASQRAGQLTRQLLAFSRNQVMEKGQLSLREVVTGLSTMLGRLIPENVQLHYDHARDLPPIHGDRCNIEQIIVNLIVNARDAMPAGGDVFISTQVADLSDEQAQRCAEARAGRFICLEVRDTGTGMDEATQRRIFEPFFTTKGESKGTGMGLATVHGIVKQHEGWIEVESAPGDGTRFRVFFPEAVSAAAPVAESVPPPAAPVRDRTVLLAEDDANLRTLVRYVLEECGLCVIEAADGHEALKLWQEHRAHIDLLLTDMVMPGGLSGADLADRIGADRPDLPVIYSSGYSVNLFGKDRQMRKDINYLPKPYLAHELASIISRALEESGDRTPKALAVA